MYRQPSVHIGHVAGWIGVGGQDQGADGRDAWIQVGIASTPGNGVAVYAEIARAGTPPKLVLVQQGVEVGQPYELAVLEMAGRAGWWRVWVDGGPVTAPIRMRGSSGRWAPMATAESWNAGTTTCNAFGFRFEDVSVSYGAGGSWRTFVPGHRFLDEGTALGEVTPSIVHSRAVCASPRRRRARLLVRRELLLNVRTFTAASSYEPGGRPMTVGQAATSLGLAQPRAIRTPSSGEAA